MFSLCVCLQERKFSISITKQEWSVGVLLKCLKGNGSALEKPQEINTKLNSAIYFIIYTNYAAIALTITKITTDKRQKIQIVGETGTFSGKFGIIQ